MLLLRKWVAAIGGSIQMDWSYANILVREAYVVRLHREKKMLHHVEDLDC